MIIGIGTDIVAIERIKRAMENPRFINRFFSQEEQVLFAARGCKAETVAANFAMKEAVVKALGTGFRGFYVRDVVILRDSLGKPYLHITAPIQQIMVQKAIASVHVTCSHEKETAVAFAVAES